MPPRSSSRWLVSGDTKLASRPPWPASTTITSNPARSPRRQRHGEVVDHVAHAPARRAPRASDPRHVRQRRRGDRAPGRVGPLVRERPVDAVRARAARPARARVAQPQPDRSPETPSPADELPRGRPPWRRHYPAPRVGVPGCPQARVTGGRAGVGRHRDAVQQHEPRARPCGAGRARRDGPATAGPRPPLVVGHHDHRPVGQRDATERSGSSQGGAGASAGRTAALVGGCPTYRTSPPTTASAASTSRTRAGSRRRRLSWSTRAERVRRL